MTAVDVDVVRLRLTSGRFAGRDVLILADPRHRGPVPFAVLPDGQVIGIRSPVTPVDRVGACVGFLIPNPDHHTPGAA